MAAWPSAAWVVTNTPRMSKSNRATILPFFKFFFLPLFFFDPLLTAIFGTAHVVYNDLANHSPLLSDAMKESLLQKS